MGLFSAEMNYIEVEHPMKIKEYSDTWPPIFTIGAASDSLVPRLRTPSLACGGIPK